MPTMQSLLQAVCLALLVVWVKEVQGQGQSLGESTVGSRLPIVFVYTVVPAVCKFGLPEYIRVSLEQSLLTQPDCHTVLLSNIGECQAILDSVKETQKAGLEVIDSTAIQSQRTKDFHNASTEMFTRDYSNELWITSALRFFLLEDLMLRHEWNELFHLEADNLLYGRLTTVLPQLRTLPMAATPANVGKSFITASVLFVSQRRHLVAFNDYLLALGSNKGGWWSKYTGWLKTLPGCCRGGTLKPFAINEMSMLAFYHLSFPDLLRLLPIVPKYPYVTNRYVIDMGKYAPGGSEVQGLSTGNAIWDAGSWGQFIGGTASRKGKDVHFSDPSHIAGQAIRTNGCRVHMLCGNMTEFGYGTTAVAAQSPARCYTAPFVRCGGNSEQQRAQPWTPLWNLHVHSKHTVNFRSVVCGCESQMEADFVHM